MQIATLRGESIRCTRAVVERQKGAERGRGSMQRCTADHLGGGSVTLLLCSPQNHYHVGFRSFCTFPLLCLSLVSFFKQLISLLSIDQAQVSNVWPLHLCPSFLIACAR